MKSQIISPLLMDLIKHENDKAYKNHCRQYTYEILNLFYSYIMLAYVITISKNLYFFRLISIFRILVLMVFTTCCILLIKKYGKKNKLHLDIGFCLIVIFLYAIHLKFFFPMLFGKVPGPYLCYFSASLESLRIFLFIGKIKWILVCVTNFILNMMQYIFLIEEQNDKGTNFLIMFASILMNTMPIMAYFQERSFKKLFDENYAYNQNLRRYEELIKAMPNQIIIIDEKKTRILFVNQAVKNFYRNASDEFIFSKIKEIDINGINLLVFIGDEEENSFKNFHTSNPYSAENEENLFDFQTGRISWQNEPAFLILMSDISAVKMVKKLKELDSYKNRLLATVSHDLRTPLNGIIGIIEILFGKIQEKELRKLLKISLRSANLLLFMINDILDFSQISNGKLRLITGKHQVMDFVKEIITLFKFQCARKNIDLILDIPNDLKNQSLICDHRRVQQVLLNFISNALKFTFHGYIKLFIRKLLVKNKRYIEFGVEDTGLGIKQKDFSKLFHLFGKIQQEDDNINQNGIGLGLVICKRLVEVLAGDPKERIEIQSQYLKGSVFSFKLPLDIPEEEEINEETCEKEEKINDHIKSYKNSAFHTNLRNIDSTSVSEDVVSSSRHILCNKILIVDDDQINLFVIGKYLESFGIKYQTASDGKIALEELQRKKDFTLVLMDCNMPIMNGFEATRKIKELVKRGVLRKISVLALTANTSEKDIELCIQSGMDGFLGKPVSKMEMKNKLQQILKIRIQAEVAKIKAKDSSRHFL